MLRILQGNRYLKTRLTVIFSLAGLLIFYHLFVLHDFYWVGNTTEAHELTHIQSIIRLCIASSLIAVLIGWRNALWAMWLSITALTVSRYILLYLTVPENEISSGELFSYLKGFIFPTVITLLYPNFGVSKSKE